MGYRTDTRIMDIVKDRFIHKVLTEEAGKLESAQTAQIRLKTTERTGRLLRDRSYRKYGSDGTFSAKLEFTFPIEERFLDIRRLGRSEKVHRRNIHNRPFMRTYNRIADRLMTGFTDAVQQQLREEIEAIRKRFTLAEG